MSESKTCTTCKRSLPLGEYHADGRGGKRSECKDCARAKAKAKGRAGARAAEAKYRERNRGELAERQAAWRLAHPERWSVINNRAVKAWRKANPEAWSRSNRKAVKAWRARQHTGQ